MQHQVPLKTDPITEVLYQEIVNCIHKARENVVSSVNYEMVKAYWYIGKRIVEIEQGGERRARYGGNLLKQLSTRLKQDFGRGFSVRTLIDIRKFYITYANVTETEKTHALRAKSQLPDFNVNLSWTHYRALITENRAECRAFYEKEAISNGWSARELERQMSSLLYERLSKSKDEKGLRKLACNGQKIITPEDVIKDPVVLEFLNIPESTRLIESDLEQALITNIQNFLLELGKGFAFVARQKRLTLDGKHYYADLVFYHTILKSYIILDLKSGELTHNDLGQMMLYVNYFDQEVIMEDDNPTVGLILCTRKSDAMVKYTLGDKVKNIFASKYQLHLPTEQELEIELKREIRKLKSRKSI